MFIIWRYWVSTVKSQRLLLCDNSLGDVTISFLLPLIWLWFENSIMIIALSRFPKWHQNEVIEWLITKQRLWWPVASPNVGHVRVTIRLHCDFIWKLLTTQWWWRLYNRVSKWGSQKSHRVASLQHHLETCHNATANDEL